MALVLVMEKVKCAFSIFLFGGMVRAGILFYIRVIVWICEDFMNWALVGWLAPTCLSAPSSYARLCRVWGEGFVFGGGQSLLAGANRFRRAETLRRASPWGSE